MSRVVVRHDEDDVRTGGGLGRDDEREGRGNGNRSADHQSMHVAPILLCPALLQASEKTHRVASGFSRKIFRLKAEATRRFSAAAGEPNAAILRL